MSNYQSSSISVGRIGNLGAHALVTLGCLGSAACGQRAAPVDEQLSHTGQAIESVATASDCQGHDDDDSMELRQRASGRVSWHRSGHGKQIPVKILGINDFHGQLSPKTVSGRPAGGAAVLASYLNAASTGIEHRTFIVHAGDQVGASPPNSALLQDEPAISVLNQLGNDDCTLRKRHECESRCNVIGTLGNHEFDEGKAELLRLLDGGNYRTGPFLEDPWRGAEFPYVSANVLDAASGKTLFPPYVIRSIDGVKIAFIGAVLRETPTIVTPTGVAGLTFLDEADSVNRYIPELHRQGVHAIILQIHKGASQRSYTGPTDTDAGAPNGDILDVISRLDNDVDVVVSGHTHQFTNAIVKNKNGAPVLLVQAFSASTAYDDIDLIIDSKTRDVISKTASIVTTWGDQGPGLTPDADIASMVAAADAKVAPLVNQLVGETSTIITRDQNVAGESALGDLIAESQRVSVAADFAFMNPGGIRANLDAGTVTWGELFTIQPFGNVVVKLTVTGQDIYDLLNQQWGTPQPAGGRMLQIAGLRYTWDSSIPEGGLRVVEVRDAGGTLIDKTASYTVAVNNFIAAGGDNFTVLKRGTNQIGGPVDLDALIAYVKSLAQPFAIAVDGRITRI